MVVRSARTVTKVNFALTPGPLARVVVNALDSHGDPLGHEASATLSFFSDVDLTSSLNFGQRAEDGRFVFPEVQPGDYTLIVSTSRNQEEAAYRKVTVTGDATLEVRTNAGATVSGRFVVQGPPRASDGAPPIANMSISATTPPGTTGVSYAKRALAQPKGTDRFELTGLRGPMVLHADLTRGLLASISRGGEDIAGKPIEFAGTERIDDLLVVFTYEHANIEVTVSGLREPDDPETVVVMLFSEDPSRWHPGFLGYTTIQATADMPLRRAPARGTRRTGRVFTCTLGSVVPGRYFVAAVPSPASRYLTEPAILERLRPLAVPVKLDAGKTTKVEVAVSR